jgi:hypothetical protein
VEEKRKLKLKVTTRLGGFLFLAPSVAAACILLLRPISLHFILVHGRHPTAPYQPFFIRQPIIRRHDFADLMRCFLLTLETEKTGAVKSNSATYFCSTVAPWPQLERLVLLYCSLSLFHALDLL